MPPSAGAPTGKRAPTIRRRTGCFTCRKRRKRCDEQRPECGGCTRAGYICEGYPVALKWDDRRSKHTSDKSPPSTRRRPLEDQITPKHRRPGVDEQDQRPQELNSQPETLPTPQWQMTDLDFWIPAADTFNDCLDILGAGFITDDLTIDHDPDDALVELPDAEESPQPSQFGSSKTPAVDIHEHDQYAPAIPPSIPFLVSGFETATERKLLYHFITRTTPVLSMIPNKTHDSPILTLVLPHALQDKMIQKSVLSLAASHVTNLFPDKCSDVFRKEKDQLVEDAEFQQLKRWKQLQASESTPKAIYKHPDFEVLLTGMLLLCLYEICDGKGDMSWRIRLNQIRELIRHALHHDPDTQRTVRTTQRLELDPWSPENTSSPSISGETEDLDDLSLNPIFIDFFIYHDILATVTDPSSPTVIELAHCRRRPSAGSDEVCVIGANNGLFDLIRRVGDLHARATDAGPPNGSVICEALDIWKDLNEWTPGTLSTMQTLASSAYKYALFVWLFFILYPDGIGAERLQSAVRDGISNMRQIDDSEGVFACMLFPCFFLGVASTTSEDREEITAQFERLRSWSGLGNVTLAQNVVRRLWEAHDIGLPRPWDWMKHKDLHGISVPVT